MNSYVTVVCDHILEDSLLGEQCGSEGWAPDSSASATQVRAYLRESGWYSSQDGRDFCPAHVDLCLP